MQRVGIDIGGTFTDLVVYDDETRRLRRTKVRTVPANPEEGLFQACREAGVDVEDVSLFLHATTLVTNLVLTRTGARTGLVTTAGFRDVLEIGRVFRNELYNLSWRKPEPFVPRQRVVEVDERIDAFGSVLQPLDPAEAASTIRSLLSLGVEAIAVCLFNSYANPEHEGLIAEVIASIDPTVPVALSSRVDPRIREYQRTSTTVLNAYAMPRVRRYIERIEEDLVVPVKLMHSGGGVVPASEAADLPVSLISSGPAAGVLASAFIGRTSGVRDIVTMDVGGTSCDVCVLRDGIPEVKDELEVEWGIPVRTQGVDVASVGAGGGSIAWIDEGGTLRVGPQSAGADPGPACYGRGGDRPTTTDANLVSGILDPHNFLGGRLTVHPDRSLEALAPLADHFSMSPDEVSVGIYRLLSASMAQAIFQMTVKRGIDPRHFTLVPFGGAGGQAALAVAEEVGIGRVLVPQHSSVLSALGLLTADLKNTMSATVLEPLQSLRIASIREQLIALRGRASSFLQGEEGMIRSISSEYILDVRYIGQSTEVPVRVMLDDDLDPDRIQERFEDQHQSLYGTRLGDPCEVVNVRVTVTGEVPPITLAPGSAGEGRSQPRRPGRRSVALIGAEVPVYDRATLAPGAVLDHPCVIEEADSTLLILEGWTVSSDELGNLVCEDVGKRPAPRIAPMAVDEALDGVR